MNHHKLRRMRLNSPYRRENKCEDKRNNNLNSIKWDFWTKNKIWRKNMKVLEGNLTWHFSWEATAPRCKFHFTTNSCSGGDNLSRVLSPLKLFDWTYIIFLVYYTTYALVQHVSVFEICFSDLRSWKVAYEIWTATKVWLKNGNWVFKLKKSYCFKKRLTGCCAHY